jgi:hypothetical protein
VPDVACLSVVREYLPNVVATGKDRYAILDADIREMAAALHLRKTTLLLMQAAKLDREPSRYPAVGQVIL